MRTLKVAALKDQLSATLRAVERGERIVVADRDRPIAVLSPVEADEGVTVLPAARPFAEVAKLRFRRTRRRVDSLAALLAERGER